ncbi:hypothetical protein D9M73_89390 [compost metagenome]
MDAVVACLDPAGGPVGEATTERADHRQRAYRLRPIEGIGNPGRFIGRWGVEHDRVGQITIGELRQRKSGLAGSHLRLQARQRHIAFRHAIGDDQRVAIIARDAVRQLAHLVALLNALERTRDRGWRGEVPGAPSARNARFRPCKLLHPCFWLDPRAASLTPAGGRRHGEFKAEPIGFGRGKA